MLFVLDWIRIQGENLGKPLLFYWVYLIKLQKFMVFVMFVVIEATKTYRKTVGGDRTQVGAC